ncbi:uncharacterized mitochondrial protein AtMg00810-like [Lactuca sativa]|uniref:uncharacterized mitochondrial protein AtMg00810-like n=1 Tax=Lactuca sativa TaxID=4236 RepID=UPI000CD83F45|nr:uncharacterized mitochondrial protein AtMg00810-like [Lactuca sativa]
MTDRLEVGIQGKVRSSREDHKAQALAGANGWKVHHLNVKSTFLNGKLEEEVYVVQPEGFEKKGSWNSDVKEFKLEMKAKFEMSDLGLLTYYLGIEVNQHSTGITLKQEAYANNLLNKTRMLDCNATRTPIEHKIKLSKNEEGELVDPTEYRSIVGALRHLTHTRPDLSFLVGVVSRFMEKPTIKHLQVVKGILRYIKGTLNYGLTYTRSEGRVTLIRYSDSDFGKDMNDVKSTGGTAFYMNGNLVTWGSQKQRSVALSSCEAEFMATTTAACQGI